MVLTKVKVLVNNTEYVDNLFSLNWEQPHLNLSDIPTFEFETDNFHGRNYNAHAIGKDVKIYRNGSLEFYGVIEPKTFSKGSKGSTVKVKGKHKGYLNLQKTICEGYRNENGAFFNPWQWGRKDAQGNEVDGINPSDVMKNLFGLKFTFQEFFDNVKNFTIKDSTNASGFIGVAIVDYNGNGLTQLMGRPASSGQFYLGTGTTPGVAHSTSLRNTPKVVDSDGTVVRQMGNISKVDVKVYGNKELSHDPIIYVCRDANNSLDTRTYVNVPLNPAKNKVFNSSFELGFTNWQLTSGAGTITIKSDVFYHGLKSAHLERTTSGTTSVRQVVSVSGGNYYTLSAYSKGSGILQGTSSWHRLYIIGRWLDASGNVIANEFPDLSLGAGTYDWTRVSTRKLAPVNAVSWRLDIGLTSTTGQAWIDAIQVEPDSLTNYEPLEFGSGSFMVWSGSVTFTGSELTKNELGYKIHPNGLATGLSSKTNRIEYLRLDAHTVSDVGLTEGIIDDYIDPTSVSGDNVVINVVGLNRLEAAEKVRKLTITSDSIEDSPHWDAWIDNYMKAHFVERRGLNINEEYSFAKYNITDIQHTFDANNLVNNVIAKGVGTPPEQLTILSTSLVDKNSIAKYGSRQGVFQDGSIKDAVTLIRRAKAYLKLYKEPVETVSLSIVNDWKKPWNVGDRIKVRDTDIGVDGNWRIISAKHKVVGEGTEKIEIEMGNKSYKAKDLFGGLTQGLKNQEVYYQGTQASAVTSSLSIPFDKDRPAVYNFIIPENVDVDRVYLYAKTNAFTANSKAASVTLLNSEAVVAGGGGGQTVGNGTFSIGNAWTTLTTKNDFGSTTFVTFSCSVNPRTSVSAGLKIRIRDDQGSVYESVQDIIRNFDFGSDFNHPRYPNLFVVYPKNAQGRTVHFELYGTFIPNQDCEVNWTITSSNSTAHNHGTEGHSHPIQFGIYQFSGDAGLFGGPMYPTQIQMFVDKLPGEAGAVAYPVWGEVGNASGSVTINKLDITETLKDSNGAIRPGAHFIAFKPASGTSASGLADSNVQGLGEIAVNHFISFNTKGTLE